MFGWGAKPAKKVDNEKELQISSLKIAFPSLRRPYNDDNVFEMRFAVDGQYNSMRITIPGDFPNSRPGRQCPAL